MWSPKGSEPELRTPGTVFIEELCFVLFLSSYIYGKILTPFQVSRNINFLASSLLFVGGGHLLLDACPLALSIGVHAGMSLLKGKQESCLHCDRMELRF